MTASIYVHIPVDLESHKILALALKRPSVLIVALRTLRRSCPDGDCLAVHREADPEQAKCRQNVIDESAPFAEKYGSEKIRVGV